MKKAQKLALFVLPALVGGSLLSSCGGTSSASQALSEPTPFDGTEYYDKVTDRVSYQTSSD
jgi:hypothetical protein